ncbi:MAG: ligase [Burkholderiaceae bacterium]|nr:ligase [Burkholderiaceae bacterium]
MQLQASADDEQHWIRQALSAPVPRPQWRVWRYRAPAIVLGLSQRRLRDEIAVRAGEALPVLVRASGGGAVLAGPWMIGATVLLPPQHALAAGALVDSYRWFGELHAGVLRAFGVESRLLLPRALREGDSRVAGFEPLAWACFGALSPWELVDSGNRKLSGLAQQRRAGGIALVAGTLLWRPPWSVLCEALDRGDALEALAMRTTDCESIRASVGLAPLDEMQRARFSSGLAAAIDAALADTLAGE